MSAPSDTAGHRQDIEAGRTVLGIELGSTRIKACLVSPDGVVLTTGEHRWENHWMEGHWTYPLEEVWTGLAACYEDMAQRAEDAFGARPGSFAALGISAMMHGYLAFDSAGELLVPFRTWRDTTTGPAARELSERLGTNIPLRWSVAHLRQAMLDEEPHVSRLEHLTTLAGYVHWKLTGRRVLGVGDASGMFPVDDAGRGYDRRRMDLLRELVGDSLPVDVAEVFPEVLRAGEPAGTLTAEGALLLDPSGRLAPGVALCPPEGDAGTGMVATNAVRARSGNVSVGTSIFAMVVLDRRLDGGPPEIDLVATPAGAPVAMVHCNNGADELSRWVELFAEVALAFGTRRTVDPDEAYAAILTEALSGEADAGGLLAFNTTSGEPVLGLEDGRALTVRAPGSSLSLSNFMRAQVYSAFAALAIGLELLDGEGTAPEALHAHGGLFRTAGVAQRFLAAATGTPVAVSRGASEGGAWGIALLAAYLDHAGSSLEDYLQDVVFLHAETHVVDPRDGDVEGFRRYLSRYREALELQRTAAATVNAPERPTQNPEEQHA
ncbi:xylulokinase [Rothia halotolerans]|uniref:xylulokinase n=1 Tax=Rothia halotolerans TaxID=405770 RepID=UPI00101B8A86|nr:FGGY-family carbohydrate kinase [Rothia halotolerans]